MHKTEEMKEQVPREHRELRGRKSGRESRGRSNFGFFTRGYPQNRTGGEDNTSGILKD